MEGYWYRFRENCNWKRDYGDSEEGNNRTVCQTHLISIPKGREIESAQTFRNCEEKTCIIYSLMLLMKEIELEEEDRKGKNRLSNY